MQSNFPLHFKNRFISILPINEGLSNDRKYRVKAVDGQQLLLRVSNISEYDQKKAEFNKMQKMDAANVPMSRPVEFGVFENEESLYQLLSWCDGEKLEISLPNLSEDEQYMTGLKTGKILQKIHSIPVSEKLDNWKNRYESVITERKKAFYDCGVRFDGWEKIVKYYETNINLLNDRPQTYLHGDFHAENLLRDDNGDLSVIDWQILDFDGFGDPWVDFRSDQCETSPHFITGCIRGYFNDEPPDIFWQVQAFYMATGSITSIPWAFYRYPVELNNLINHNLNILKWFDGMENPMPTWYLKDYVYNN